MAVDQYLYYLQEYRNGKQKFPCHIERFDKGTVKVNGHHKFKVHIACGEATSAGFAVLKNEFLDQLIANIDKRLPYCDIFHANRDKVK